MIMEDEFLCRLYRIRLKNDMLCADEIGIVGPKEKISDEFQKK